MAAGLGTRMRSAIPKHLHPILGRRMVDWVSRRRARSESIRSSSSRRPRQRRRLRRARGRGAGESRSARGTPSAARGRRSRARDDVLVLSGDTPLLTTALLSELVETHRREAARRRPCSRSSPTDTEAVRPRVCGRRRRARRDRRASPTQRPSSARLREVNSSIYVFRADSLWPVLDRLDAAQRAGRALPDRLGAPSSSRTGERVAVHKGGDPVETEGVNTRVELAAAAAALRDRINEAHMLAGVTIVDPASTWIDAEVELEPDAVVHPFTVIRGASRDRGPRRGRAARRRRRHRWSGEDALVGPFCYLRPGTVLEAGAKAGAFVELKNSHIGEGTKVPHLSYMGDAESASDTNIGAGNITVNPDHDAREGADDDRAVTSGRGVDNAFVAPVIDRRRCMDCSRLRRSQRMYLRRALGDRPGEAGEQGRARWKAGRLSRRCPGSGSDARGPSSRSGARRRSRRRSG